MKAMISLDGIYSFLQSLSLNADNKRWLAEKLLKDVASEEKTEKADKTQPYAEFIESVCGAWNDDPRSTDSILSDVYSARQYGKTRHIMPLTDEEN